MNKRYIKDKIISIITISAAVLSASALIVIVSYIFSKGLPLIGISFLTNNYNDEIRYVILPDAKQSFDIPSDIEDGQLFLKDHGIVLQEKQINSREKVLEIVYIFNGSPFENASDTSGNSYKLRPGDVIDKVSDYNVDELTEDQLLKVFDETSQIKLRIVRPGNGIKPMIITTLMLILISLLLVIPVGVLAAIYLVKYARPGRVVNLIRFAVEALSGIPSIVYGLFGMIFFVKILSVGTSLLSGSLTLSILLLPTVIRTTEETLKTVPESYIEGSYSLGANRLQTLVKIILPHSIPGILVSVILSIGRIVGESAALLFTMGTFAKIPVNIRDSGATLTVRAFMEIKEYANVEMAAAMGVVLIVIVFMLNFAARFVSHRISSRV